MILVRRAPRARMRPRCRDGTESLGPSYAAADDAKSLFYPYGTKSMEQTLTEMAEAVDQYAGSAST